MPTALPASKNVTALTVPSNQNLRREIYTCSSFCSSSFKSPRNLSSQEWGSYVLVQFASGTSQSFGYPASEHSSTSLHSQPSVRGLAFSGIGAVHSCKARACEGEHRVRIPKRSQCPQPPTLSPQPSTLDPQLENINTH